MSDAAWLRFVARAVGTGHGDGGVIVAGHQFEDARWVHAGISQAVADDEHGQVAALASVRLGHHDFGLSLGD